MTTPDLSTLTEGRGIRSAALFGAQSELLAQSGNHEDMASLLTPAQAIVQTLEQTLGTGSWNDLLLDLDSGPVLLTPGPSGQVLAVGFDELSSLGRVRLSVGRVLDSLTN
ncbi:roadblock/LC7 domain-containing protein [Deinococcus radiophilus]|uniref:Roadblock/LC7 domain-containing protein n=1 Tax=Deinococcus radiophilus TaxID=32062 RepID=A0A431VTW6_9DEIO|nr:roadblock/LC7 domain-containing protein [Deinococcus radiophilus]RTR26656.1 roadblock/LC7 domain-containing protein [Deinococcus radiophilus]UFA51017.1 roadblock/LC7 domain-containing protein [Deinococcus radiophilus]